jgi:leucyl/phenylalanyl-tRNA--protein transferase
VDRVPRGNDFPIDLDLLLRAYAQGIFPMADARDDPEIFWVEPKKRAILPLDGFHCARSLRKVIASDRFRVRSDTCFAKVIAACAEAAPDRPGTWINGAIERAFLALHQRGLAHSVECWERVDGEDMLVGGLYGLALGRAFFGESMFSRRTNASKVALAWLVARLRVGGYQLLDCQFMTDHLRSLGAVEITAREYQQRLYSAVSPSSVSSAGAAAASSGGSFSTLDSLLAEAARGLASPSDALELPGVSSSPGKVIAQLLTQTS